MHYRDGVRLVIVERQIPPSPGGRHDGVFGCIAISGNGLFDDPDSDRHYRDAADRAPLHERRPKALVEVGLPGRLVGARVDVLERDNVGLPQSAAERVEKMN